MIPPWHSWANRRVKEEGQKTHNEYVEEYNSLEKQLAEILEEKGFPPGSSIIEKGIIREISPKAKSCGLDDAEIFYSTIGPKLEDLVKVRNMADFMGIEPKELVNAYKRLDQILGDEYKAIWTWFYS